MKIILANYDCQINTFGGNTSFWFFTWRFWGDIASLTLTPLPEKATYFGGGGNSYFSLLLSDNPTLSPLGYLPLNSWGTTL